MCENMMKKWSMNRLIISISLGFYLIFAYSTVTHAGIVKKISFKLSESMADQAVITTAVVEGIIGSGDLYAGPSGGSTTCYACRTWDAAAFLVSNTPWSVDFAPSFGKWAPARGSSVSVTVRCSTLSDRPLADSECRELTSGVVSRLELTGPVLNSQGIHPPTGAPVGELFDRVVVPAETGTVVQIPGKSGIVKVEGKWPPRLYVVKLEGFPHDPGRTVGLKAGYYYVEVESNVDVRYQLANYSFLWVGNDTVNVRHKQRIIGKMQVEVVETVNLTADKTELNCGTVVVGNGAYKECPVVTFRNGSAPIDLRLWSLAIDNVGGELKLYADDGSGHILPIGIGTKPVRDDGTMHLYISGRDMKRSGVVRGNLTVTARAK